MTMTMPARLRSINLGQLATATDRLLVLGSPRRANLARGSSPDLASPLTHLATPSVTIVQPRRSHRLAIAAAVVFGIVLGFGTTRIAMATSQDTTITHAP